MSADRRLRWKDVNPKAGWHFRTPCTRRGDDFVFALKGWRLFARWSLLPGIVFLLAAIIWMNWIAFVTIGGLSFRESLIAFISACVTTAILVLFAGFLIVRSRRVYECVVSGSDIRVNLRGATGKLVRTLRIGKASLTFSTLTLLVKGQILFASGIVLACDDRPMFIAAGPDMLLRDWWKTLPPEIRSLPSRPEDEFIVVT